MTTGCAFWLLGIATLASAAFTALLATVAHSPVTDEWFGGAWGLVLGIGWALILSEVILHGWDNTR